MRDAVVFGLIVLSFATFVTTHVALVFVLSFSLRPRWRGLAALVIPPLGPLWAWEGGHRKKAILWVVAVVLYAVGLAVATSS